MGDHLKYAGADAETQRRALETIIRSEPVLMAALSELRAMAVPDYLIAAGAIYNCVWNHLTGRPPLQGVNDIDVVYFDPDTSWDAEDRVIKACADRFRDFALPVQVRNQARVHLWFEQKFGIPFLPLHSSAEMLGRYASTAYAVGVRLGDGASLEIVAPFGLDDLFSFRLVPNPALDNRALHMSKGEKLKTLWPELTVLPWVD